jgi:mannose/fructose/N-acetylgalactosamine-specific phosphotransferase system component IIC
MSAMFFRSRNHESGRNIAALIVPPFVTATAIATILVTAHTLAGTPEVLATIAVPFTVSTTYAILYNLRLWRAAYGR